MSGQRRAEPGELAVVRALQIDPRLPFTTIAAALGVSEPTVSRRYARLRRTGAVRVTGVLDPGALGQSQWTVRLRCRPGRTAALADHLARRSDVAWVSIGGAGTRITCAVRSRSPQQREDLLGRRLPRASAVLDVETCVLLRKFLGGRGRHWTALSGVLTAGQEALLGSTGSPFTESAVDARARERLDDNDEAMLAVLAVDGRAPLVELAAASGLTPGRAARRLQALVADRVVHLHLELAPALLGLDVRADLWLRVRPGEVTRAGRALARMPGIGFVAAVSGRDNVHVQAHCSTLDELFELASERVGSVPGVEAVEVDPVDRLVKQAGTLPGGSGPLPVRDARTAVVRPGPGP